jgi:uncharacterized protein DUF4340
VTARRVVLLLVAGLVLIAFAMWVASQRHLERASLTGDLVLPDLEHNVNAVTQVELRRGDGSHTTLKKDASGAWSVGERDWPAETTRVRKLLLDLGALNIVEEKTRLPANYPQLGVDDVTSPKATGTRIDLSAAPRSWALIVGKSSSGKSGYVRVASMPQSLLAAPLITVDADPRGWLEHGLLDVSAQRVREVQEHPLEGAGYSVSRAKKEQANFSVTPLPKGRELTGPGAADPVAGALTSLTLDDLGKARSDTDAKTTHALYRTFDGLEVDVAGRKDGTRCLVSFSARATGKDGEAEAQKLTARLSGREFDIPEYKYSAIFRPLDELLKKPPEPLKKAAAATPGKGPAAKKTAVTPTPTPAAPPAKDGADPQP